jgi:hypothetical protein
VHPNAIERFEPHCHLAWSKWKRLYLDRTTHGIDDARELQQQPVTRGLDDAPTMAGDCRVDHLLAKGFQRCQRAALVAAHRRE